MSDSVDPQSRPAAKRGEPADRQAFAQVEKWMAMIREINDEPAAQAKHQDGA
jgi:hypothetical protein